jgi:hypothetical protein
MPSAVKRSNRSIIAAELMIASKGREKERRRKKGVKLLCFTLAWSASWAEC